MRYRNEITAGQPGRHRIVSLDPSKNLDVAVPSRNRLVRSCNDELIPNFHRRKANGEIFNNPYSSSRTEYRSSGAYRNHHAIVNSNGVKTTDDLHEWTGCDLEIIAGASNCPLVILSMKNADVQAQQECLARVNKTEFDLGTFAGEWHKTKLLHRDVGQALLKLLTPLKQRVSKGRVTKHAVYDAKGNPVLNRNGRPVYRYSKTADKVHGESAMQNTKDIANAWLVTRYGIGPLISELENACKFLGRSKALRKTARSYYLASGSTRSVKTVADTPGVWHVQYDRVRTVQVRYGILYDTTAFAEGLASLGLSRPFSTAWELVSYSFVLDWFFRVGLWLDAAQPSFASKTLCSWRSLTETETLTSQVLGITPKAPETGVSYSPSWNGASSEVVTSKSRSLWTATMPFTLVQGSGFSTMRCADFASLILQRFHTRL